MHHTRNFVKPEILMLVASHWGCLAPRFQRDHGCVLLFEWPFSRSTFRIHLYSVSTIFSARRSVQGAAMCMLCR